MAFADNIRKIHTVEIFQIIGTGYISMYSSVRKIPIEGILGNTYEGNFQKIHMRGFFGICYGGFPCIRLYVIEVYGEDISEYAYEGVSRVSYHRGCFSGQCRGRIYQE